MFKLIASFLLIQLVLMKCSADSIVIPAAGGTQTDQIGLLFFGYDKSEPGIYYTTFIELHKKLDSNLWISLVDWSSETASIEELVKESVSQLTKAGMSINKSTPFYFVGHSTGGEIIQDYIINQLSQARIPVNLAGLILANSYITRENLAKLPLNLNILTIGGELDGLVRITRIAESDYFDITSKENEFKRLTLLIEGMNHFQFCGTNHIPLEVEAIDFKSEINNNQARDQITSILTAFIRIHSYNMSSESDINVLHSYMTTTVRMLNPLIQAYHLESSERLFRPCNTLINKTDCTIGCQWSAYAQKVMAGGDVNIISHDTFHAVPHEKNPIEFPAIHNNCSNSKSNCVVNVTTVSQLIYRSDARSPLGAQEIRTKLMSRQSILLAATGIKYNWTETDGSGYRCAEINDFTIEWAINLAPNRTKNRYLNHGRILRTVKDKGPLNIGPLWIDSPLEYKNIDNNKGGKNYTEIISATLNTPVDFWLKSAAAFHYCKLLSPIRALEWIYFDSLMGQSFQ